MIVYEMEWDYDDARFKFFNRMVVSNVEKWEEMVFKKCQENRETLEKAFEEIDYDADSKHPYETDFDEWVKWCINNFVYITSFEVDNYDNY